MAVVSKWAFTALFAYVWAKTFRKMSDAEAKAIGAATAMRMDKNPPNVEKKFLALSYDRAKQLPKKDGESFTAMGTTISWRTKGDKTVATVGKAPGTPELFNKYCRKEIGSSWAKAMKLAKEFQGYEPDFKSLINNRGSRAWGPVNKLMNKCKKGDGVDLDCVADIDPYSNDWQRKKRTKEENKLYKKESQYAGVYKALVSEAKIDLNLHDVENDSSIEDGVKKWESLDSQEQELLIDKVKLLSPARRELEELPGEIQEIFKEDRSSRVRRVVEDADTEVLEDFFDDESEIVLLQVAKEIESDRLAEFLSYPLPYDVMEFAARRLLFEAIEDVDEVTDERAQKFLSKLMEKE